VGLTALRLAEALPAAGRPLQHARITRCAGQRSATVGRPAVTAGASAASARRGSTIVKAPGQKRAASACARGSITASFSAAATSGTCTISGLKSGRPLAR
jgi:hypothetical protein